MNIASDVLDEHEAIGTQTPMLLAGSRTEEFPIDALVEVPNAISKALTGHESHVLGRRGVAIGGEGEMEVAIPGGKLLISFSQTTPVRLL